MAPKFATAIRTRLIAGLILIVPLAITFIAGAWIIRLIGGLLRPVAARLRIALILNAPVPDWLAATLHYAVVVALGLALVYLLGLFSTTFVVRRAYAFGEWMLLRIPLIKSIYALTKQVMDLVASREAASFKEVVAIEYPKEDCWALAFVTGETRLTDDPRPFVNVFLPTTPNPTSRFMLMAPRASVRYIDITIETAVKMIMSGGAITPEWIGSARRGDPPVAIHAIPAIIAATPPNNTAPPEPS